MVGLNDYQLNFDSAPGFGGEQNQELFKAIQAGQITGRDTTGLSLTQEPLKAESLEQVLKLLEFRMKDIALWNSVPKMAAYNTVEEFLQLESYGENRGGFYSEGELSDVEDSSYIRRAAIVKYIQVTGEVSMQAQMVKSFVDAMAKEVENKTMWVLRKANGALTKGDSKIVPQEWDGFYAQHASIGNTSEGALYSNIQEYYESEVVYDLRGASLTQDDLEDIAVILDENFGDVDTIFAPPSVLSGLAKDFYEKQRILLGATGSQFVGGGVPKSISTSIGDVKMVTDKFMKADKPKTSADNATSVKAPNAPATVDAVAVAATVTATKFDTATDAGDYQYAVSAVNRFGESALTIDAAAVTVVQNGAIDITISKAGGAIPATGYIIYRSKKGQTGTFYPIFKISESERANGFDGAAAGVVRDKNRFLPDTEQALVLGNSTDVWSFKQLAPISKLDLAVLSMSNRFITYLFGTPVLYTPKKVVRILNVGKYVGA